MFFRKRRQQGPGFVHKTGARGTPAKELLSTDARYKAIITEGPMPGFQVKTYKLVSDDRSHPEGYWEQVEGPSYTDTLDTAEQLAQDQLAEAIDDAATEE